MSIPDYIRATQQTAPCNCCGGTTTVQRDIVDRYGHLCDVCLGRLEKKKPWLFDPLYIAAVAEVEQTTGGALT